MSNKDRFAFWVSRDTLQLIKEKYRGDCCKTQSEFIEKAVRFYCGYLDAERSEVYLPRVISNALEGMVGLLGSKMGRLIFKQAVEVSIMSHIIAADTDIDNETLEKLRNRCVHDIKHTNGQISFKEILEFQKTE